MPNTGHITICPYYLSERAKAITCEDVFRRFRSKKDKDDWMKKYCDTDWMECKYAQELHKLHTRINEKGENERMVELFKQKTSATREELKKITTQLGKAEAKVTKQEDMIRYLKERDETAVKRIADLQEENTALVENIERIRQKNQELFKKWQDEKTDIKKREEKLLQEMIAQSVIYEGYVAYLMDAAKMEIFDMDDFHKWTEEFEYRLLGSDEKKIKLEVVWRKRNGDKGSAGEVPEASDREDEPTGSEDTKEPDGGKETE